MAIYHESGLELNLPDGLHFRFADLPVYIKLKGQNLKEMDFCWLHQDALVMVEVRDYRAKQDDLRPEDFKPKQSRFEALVDKMTGSLLLLAAAWSGTTKGQEMRAELPKFAQNAMVLKPIIVIYLARS